jgi:hypothetical protein
LPLENTNISQTFERDSHLKRLSLELDRLLSAPSLGEFVRGSETDMIGIDRKVVKYVRNAPIDVRSEE